MTVHNAGRTQPTKAKVCNLSRAAAKSVRRLQQNILTQETFRAGGLTRSFHKWRRLTSDRSILDTVHGFKLDFMRAPPGNRIPQQLITRPEEIDIAKQLLKQLLDKQVICETKLRQSGYTSNIFLRPKRSGGHRLILNLKHLNNYVEYFHFKMDNLQTATRLTTQNCWFTSLDLSDAYYSVNVAKEHRKFLQFAFEGTTYHFTCLANGITSAPRTFTKIMKVPLAQLREQFDMTIMAYLDDILIIGQSQEEVITATAQAFQMFSSLGFAISASKSVVKPSQTIEFLGFTLDSSAMLVTLTAQKRAELITDLKLFVTKQSVTIRDFAKIVGRLAATLPGNRYGMLFLKNFEWAKAKALRRSRGKYEGQLTLTAPIKSDLQWWLDNIDSASRPMYLPNPSLTLYTDASFQGWGCFCPDTGQRTGGRWHTDELSQDINCLELTAVKFALLALCQEYSGHHILIYSDNTTTVVGINKQGSTQSPNCNQIARDIWTWAMELDVWLSATHCPGSLNVEADDASRIFNDSTEWKLNSNSFEDACTSWGELSIDLFASRLNHQLIPYCAWQPDPHAFAVDCFLLDWGKFKLNYAFPPFSLVNRVLQKLVQDQAEAVIVVPKWTTQPWFPRLRQLMIHPPVPLPVTHGTLQLVHDPKQPHPLAGRLTLWVCRVSGLCT